MRKLEISIDTVSDNLDEEINGSVHTVKCIKDYGDKDVVPHYLLRHRLAGPLSSLKSIQSMLKDDLEKFPDFKDHCLSDDFTVEDALVNMRGLLIMISADLNEYYKFMDSQRK